MIITSVIELRVIQLKAIFQAKAHITYLAAVALSTQHTSPEILIFQFWAPVFSDNVFQSAMELCFWMPVSPVHSVSVQQVHIS
jgi:hypothetical protein